MSDVQTRIDDLVKNNRVVLFMKGTPDFPQCGFSMRAVSVVRALGVPFQTVDVLSDMDVRQGIKTYSDWPTIPQLYIDGSFIGGSDIMMEMFQTGDLQNLIEPATEG
ncbi:MAG: Grx4 family monothiol glutaredoxin [Myxococcota bacterium]